MIIIRKHCKNLFVHYFGANTSVMCYQLLGRECGNKVFPSGPPCSLAQGRNNVCHVRAAGRHGSGQGDRAAPGPLSEQLSLGRQSSRGMAARGQAMQSGGVPGPLLLQACWVGWSQTAGLLPVLGCCLTQEPQTPWEESAYCPLLRQWCVSEMGSKAQRALSSEPNKSALSSAL